MATCRPEGRSDPVLCPPVCHSAADSTDHRAVYCPGTYDSTRGFPRNPTIESTSKHSFNLTEAMKVSGKRVGEAS